MKTLLAILPLAFLIWGCSTSSDHADDNQKHKNIVVIPKGGNHIYWRSVLTGCENAANEANFNLVWKSPKEENHLKGQISMLNDINVDNCDALVIAPISSTGLNGALRKVKAKGIPIVIIDSDIKSTDYDAFVATDNSAAGSKCAKRTASMIGESGKILIVRYLESSGSTLSREEGFINTITHDYPEISLLVPKQFSGPTLEQAFTLVKDHLGQNDDIDAIFCPNEPTMMGALRALQTTGHLGRIKLLGFDANEALLNAVRNGYIEALAVQAPYQIGALSIETSKLLIKGEKVEKEVHTGVKFITPENIDTDAIKKYLDPTS